MNQKRRRPLLGRDFIPGLFLVSGQERERKRGREKEVGESEREREEGVREIGGEREGGGGEGEREERRCLLTGNHPKPVKQSTPPTEGKSKYKKRE